MQVAQVSENGLSIESANQISISPVKSPIKHCKSCLCHVKSVSSLDQSTADNISSILKSIGNKQASQKYKTLENVADFRQKNYKLQYFRDGNWYNLHGDTCIQEYEIKMNGFFMEIQSHDPIKFSNYEHGRDTTNLYRNRHQTSAQFLQQLIIDNESTMTYKSDHKLMYWDIEVCDVDCEFPSADRIREQKAFITMIQYMEDSRLTV